MLRQDYPGNTLIKAKTNLKAGQDPLKLQKKVCTLCGKICTIYNGLSNHFKSYNFCQYCAKKSDKL